MTKILVVTTVLLLTGLNFSYGAEDPKRDQAMEEALQSVMLKGEQNKSNISAPQAVPVKPKKQRRSLFSRLF